jgi:anti-sigma regulatory factor (Ser/Thr protein kinase)
MTRCLQAARSQADRGGGYYVVSEMLTNVTKHAQASVVEVDAEASGGTLWVCVRDDGVRGADPLRGAGRRHQGVLRASGSGRRRVPGRGH